ncbi:MAG: cell division protein FtsB [Sulfuritalea sp.]|nr:cell division protein FtsB [Sulfuritalea sp.]
MNWPTLVLVVLIALLQYPLWLGKGGWLRVWDYDRQLQTQREINLKLEQRNAALDAEVRDLKAGFEAIEERARYDLGMIKAGEIFVQVPQKPIPAPAPAESPTPGSIAKAGVKPSAKLVVKPPLKPETGR